jgi:two-component system NtrC family sensor kinase
MRARISWLAALMALAIAVVAGLAYWDARRESQSALTDFGREQATLAQAIAAAVSSRAKVGGPSTADAVELLSYVRYLEQPSSLAILLRRPGDGAFTTAGGTRLRDIALETGFAVGAPSVRLERSAAPAFGLPERTAVAGLSTFDGPGGRWGVVVVATALRERDRELRAQWRSVAAVMLAAGLVFVFGGLALIRQRKELELGRELSIAELRREREEQLVRIDKLATMAALATGIAHEIATPLGVIVGRAEQLLLKVKDDERAKRSVDAIIEQGNRIDHVVRGFLDLARGGSPVLEHVNPGIVAEAARELVEHRFAKAGVGLTAAIDAGLPSVACDPRLLEHALINLLLNACDACEPGGSVELGVHSSGERVRFEVEDDGAGITEEAAARAMEPFFTTKPAGKGTGLGLSIATEIVKHHGGQLSLRPRDASDVKGKKPNGTRATVELPAVKETA